MKKDTVEALQKVGELLAAQEYGETEGNVTVMHICNPCQHDWDFSRDDLISCKNCGYTEFFDDDEKCSCNVIGCEVCDERALENFDCGKLPSGLCMKAGSEECDFECPNRD